MNKEKKHLLVFGYGFSVLIPLLTIRHGMKHDFSWFSFILLGIACLLLFLSIFRYQWLKPVYDKWMVVAYFIGTVITTIILFILFYFVFGFVGIMLRLLNKDLLDREIDSQKVSYWKDKERDIFNRENYLKQF